MLTDSEREWVRENKTRNGCIFARRCKYTCFEPPYCPVIPTKENLIDAAEFEGRVAAKLAITGDAWDFEDMPCRGERQYMRSKCPLRKNHWDCADCYIKAARLQVEEEMDAVIQAKDKAIQDFR